ILFNYLGRFTEREDTPGHWRIAGKTPLTESAEPGAVALHVLEAEAMVRDVPGGPELTITLAWPDTILTPTTAQHIGQTWLAMLAGLASTATTPGAGGHTPTDFPLTTLTHE